MQWIQDREHEIIKLEEVARAMRRDILTMISRAGSGHPGGSLSCVEIIATLYFYVMRYRRDDLSWPGRDRFILSKGHAAPTLYSALSLAGIIDRKTLETFRQIDSPLQGHPDATRCPCVEMTSGPLGQGLSFANGVAYAIREDGHDGRVYVLMGDGELQEGQVWEAVMTAARHGLGNIIAVVDYNGLQLDGTTAAIKPIRNYMDVFGGFGWGVDVVDGHSFGALIDSLTKKYQSKTPSVIIAQTVKGKGIRRMEGRVEWHGGKVDRGLLSECLVELGY